MNTNDRMIGLKRLSSMKYTMNPPTESCVRTSMTASGGWGWAGRRAILSTATSVEELRDICIESGVKMIGCQMTVDLFDFNPADFVKGVELGGAATFFSFAGEADVSLFI